MRKAAKAKPAKASKSRLAAAATNPARRASRSKPAATPARKTATAARITLAAECTLRDAPALQALLVGTVSATGSVTIEAGAVQRIDAAALQLLVAFARRERAAGRRLDWHQPSTDLIDSSARLGLTEVLGLAAPAGKPA